MPKPKRAKTTAELSEAVETLATDFVNHWITAGFTTSDMRDYAMKQQAAFGDFMLRGIRYFGDAGRYPEYAERLNPDGTERSNDNAEKRN